MSALFALALAACSAPPPAAAPDLAMAPETPIPDIPFGAPLPLKPELVFDTGGKSDPIVFLGALPGEVVAVGFGHDLHTLPSGTPDSIEPHELGTDVGFLWTTLAFGHGNGAQVLVGGERGLFSIVAGILERSPIGPQLVGSTVKYLFDSGTPEEPVVWIITDAALHLWHAGVLRRIHIDSLADGHTPTEINPGRARLAACRDPEGGHGRLYIRQDDSPLLDRLLVVPANAALSNPGSKDTHVPIETILVGHEVHAIACDSRGILFAGTYDGLLIEVRPDGTLAPGRLPKGLQAGWIFADPGAPDVWFGDAHYVAHVRAGQYQVVDADFSPFDGSMPPQWLPSNLAADIGGPLLVAGKQRIGRLRVKTVIELKGLPQKVDAPVLVDISAPYPALIRKIDADLDGTAQWADTASRRAGIDPWSVPEGKHAFTVTVTYSDGPPLSVKTDVQIVRPPAPTWTRDVGPVYEARCKKCHGPNGSGHLMATPERWQAEIGTILPAIKERRMPLPPNEPLSGIEVALVAGWKVMGFAP